MCVCDIVLMLRFVWGGGQESVHIREGEFHFFYSETQTDGRYYGKGRLAENYTSSLLVSLDTRVKLSN